MIIEPSSLRSGPGSRVDLRKTTHPTTQPEYSHLASAASTANGYLADATALWSALHQLG
jgi:hypothetical protein